MTRSSTGADRPGSHRVTEIDALARQAANPDDPSGALSALGALRGRLAELELEQVSRAVAGGLSWSDIATALGISRQAAHKRYARKVRTRASVGAQGEAKILVTSEARRAVQLARDEAHDQGVTVVGTEHLLLGILRSERSAAAQALRELGAGLEEARAVVEPTLVEDAEQDSGFEPRHPAWRGLSPYTRSVLERSLSEAVGRGEGYIGVEHLLLAILGDPKGGAARTLARLEVDARAVRERLLAAW